MDIDDFLAQKCLAVVGVSRTGKKFGNIILRELRARGYRVFPVNPHATELEGKKCYPTLDSLPEPALGVVINLPPAKALLALRDARAAGIRLVWLQQGSESDEAVEFCEQSGISVVVGQCILMFARPVKFPHNFHGWAWKLFGMGPEI